MCRSSRNVFCKVCFIEFQKGVPFDSKRALNVLKVAVSFSCFNDFNTYIGVSFDSKRALYLSSRRGCVPFMFHSCSIHVLFMFHRSSDDEWSFTDMMFDMAVTIVPIGLLLSALPTGLFTFAVRR